MPAVNYNKIVPAGTYLADWMEYNAKSECPYAYDFWSGLWLLSVALGRSIYVDRPFAPVYLNLYCILVAESGITRKSTSVRRAVSFARNFCGRDNYLIESKITPEMLERNLAEQTKQFNSATCTIAIDELVKFLGKEKYVDYMPSLLTDLYDSPQIRSGGGTISRGEADMRNVYVNFLSASTPSWLLRAVNPDVIEGGFTSRVIFVVCEHPKQSTPWPEQPHEHVADSIRHNLATIKKQAGDVQKIAVSPVARRVFEAWYKRRERRRDPFRSSFQSREDGHVLRISALLCINDGTWEIQANHIKIAIKIISEVREFGASIFAGAGSHSKIVLGIDAIRDKLLSSGLSGCAQGSLTSHCQRYMNAAHVQTALAIMHELSMVQKFASIQVERGRPTTIWRATKELASTKSLDKIIEQFEPI